MPPVSPGSHTGGTPVVPVDVSGPVVPVEPVVVVSPTMFVVLLPVETSVVELVGLVVDVVIPFDSDPAVVSLSLALALVVGVAVVLVEPGTPVMFVVLPAVAVPVSPVESPHAASPTAAEITSTRLPADVNRIR